MSGISSRPRIMHVVTGGFSGATQVAVDLATAAQATSGYDVMLVLRHKRQADPARVQALRDAGLNVNVLPGWSHVATIHALWSLCRHWRPQLMVAHGFPEHLLARWAGLLAGVPHLIHVEHNSRERYSAWQRWQSLFLAHRTDALVGCSEGVRQSLLAMGLPEAKTHAISNGIRWAPFAEADQRPFNIRQPGLVMASRFARQKDHATLIQALALLRDQYDLRPPLLLAGGGSARHRRAAQKLTQALNLGEQVQFLGHCQTLPELLQRHQFAVLCSHYEGMPLSLVEGMAAGCAVIGSDVPGIREMLRHGDTGWLVPESDAQAWANALAQLLTQTGLAAELAQKGRAHASTNFRLEHMLAGYDMLFSDVLGRPSASSASPPLP